MSEQERASASHAYLHPYPSPVLPQRFSSQRVHAIAIVFRSLPAKMTIVEPTFKQMVVLYRDLPVAAAENVDAKKEAAAVAAVALQNRRIHIKTFRDIPYSDATVIFPHLKVRECFFCAGESVRSSHILAVVAHRTTRCARTLHHHAQVKLAEAEVLKSI